MIHDKLFNLLKNIGHTLRHEGIAETILEGTVEGHKRKGRQRLEYVKKLYR